VYANEIAFFVVVHVQGSLVGTMQRLTDAARQVNVGGGYDDCVMSIIDRHDPVKRMLGILKLLLIAGKVNDLFFMQSKEFSG
jgi:hypothetical protein